MANQSAKAGESPVVESPVVIEETPAPAPVTETTSALTETVKENVLVEYLRGPVPVTESINGQDIVVGMASLQRIESTDYKTKQPTGEKLIFLAFVPNQGRAWKARWKHAEASVDAIRATLTS